MDTEDLKFKKAMKELEKFVKILEKDKKFNMSNNVFISIETIDESRESVVYGTHHRIGSDRGVPPPRVSRVQSLALCGAS